MSILEGYMEDPDSMEELHAAYARMEQAIRDYETSKPVEPEPVKRARALNLPPFESDPDASALSVGQVQEVIDVLEDWFKAIGDGSADLRVPSPFGMKVTEEQADRLIQVIDDYILYELYEHPDFHAKAGIESKGKPMDIPADFARLKGLARIAFAQDVFMVTRKVYSEGK